MSRAHRSLDFALAAFREGPGPIFPRGDLPDALKTFVQSAVPASGPIPEAVRLRQRGEMRLAPNKPWLPFTAEQVIAVRRAGFLWRARVRMAPLLQATVVDSYIGGEGRLEARLLGLFPVAKAGGPETAKGELMRYLAELPLAPSAILYNPELRWRSIDERSVEASADCSGGEARVRLKLDPANGVVGAEADDRPRLAGARAIASRWRGRFFGHKEVSGYRIPACAEIGWELPEGAFLYWRGEITSLETIPPLPAPA